MTAIRITDHFRELQDNFDLVLCDVWGVIHNGVAAFDDACDALARFRAGGGTVVLITNAPRPSSSVVVQLQRLSVDDAVYDGIVTSGDVTRRLIRESRGEAAYHLGPARDLPIFDGLDLKFAPAEQADFIVCTGLFDDETETPDDYRALLTGALARRLPMICANPDLVVERGDTLIYCAGALAELYRTLGGEVVFGGKPHRPIYDQAVALASERRGRTFAHHRVLAIGDSVRTDLEGANAYGIACLFVTAGIHSAEFGKRHAPDVAALSQVLGQASKPPSAVTPRLRW
jgi:HAD superfamily hydrolase (TIGR01459 family)